MVWLLILMWLYIPFSWCVRKKTIYLKMLLPVIFFFRRQTTLMNPPTKGYTWIINRFSIILLQWRQWPSYWWPSNWPSNWSSMIIITPEPWGKSAKRSEEQLGLARGDLWQTTKVAQDTYLFEWMPGVVMRFPFPSKQGADPLTLCV